MTSPPLLPLGALLTLVSAALALSLAGRGRASGRFAAWIAIAATVVAPALTTIVVLSGQSASLQGMVALDGRTMPGVLFACASGGFAVLLELGNARRTRAPRFALILYAVAGVVVVAQSTHMLPAVLGLAVFAAALGALMRPAVSWTYFVLSAVGLATLCLGVVLMYGASGSLRTDVIALQAADGATKPLAVAGQGLLLAGLGLGIGLAPFHTWIAGNLARLSVSESYLAGVLAPQAALAMLSRLAQAWPLQGRQLIAWLGAISVVYGYGRALAAGRGRPALAGIVTAQAGTLILHTLLPGDSSGPALYLAIGSFALTGACLWAGVAAPPHPGGLGPSSPWLRAALSVGLLNLVGLLPLLGATVQIQLYGGLLREGYIGPLIAAAAGQLTAWVLGVRWMTALWAGPYADVQSTPELEIVAGAAATAIVLGGLNAGAIAQWLVALAGAG
ncbi:MAG: hypothetical protein JXA09_17575 [Anaerolineae bacterium]|nr:hypothetical protein [Anaerolineae bacterium]